MKQKSEPAPMPLVTRYALTGGAIGLYFGLFFRPGQVEEPRLSTILFLATIVAIVMTALYAFQKRPSFSKLPVRFVSTFIKATLVLAVLEGRYLAYDVGEKAAVIVFTVVMGVLSGLWFAYEQSRQTNQ